jgi:hypothetical protein
MTDGGAAAPRIARLFDGIDEGRADIGDRGEPCVEKERDSILSYLNKGKVILRTSARDVDRVDESREKVVPIAFRTDGTWIWSEAVAYYLTTHDVVPEADFRDHLRRRGYRYQEPSEDEVKAASAALRARRRRQP